jgi:hypothetical protein
MYKRFLVYIILFLFSFGVIFGSGWHPAEEILTGNFTGYYDLDNMPNVANVPLQIRVSSSCIAGSSIRAINSDGSVVCETDDISAGGETDPIFTAWDKSTGISITESQISDLTHTVDINTQLTEGEVDAYADNNGYLTSYSETDPQVGVLTAGK